VPERLVSLWRYRRRIGGSQSETSKEISVLVFESTSSWRAEEANAKELGLAKMLVGVLEAKFEPEKWKDRYEERLKALIESRSPVAADSRQSEPRQAPGRGH
jgi:non-homologous end joining protein Ku